MTKFFPLYLSVFGKKDTGIILLTVIKTSWNAFKMTGTCRYWKFCFEQDTHGSFGPVGLLEFLEIP